MAMINVNLLKGRSGDQKRFFAQAVTREAVRILECRAEAVDVLFTENPAEDWAAGGVLIADAKK
jgi:4-oxalocrotonate tautomerase